MCQFIVENTIMLINFKNFDSKRPFMDIINLFGQKLNLWFFILSSNTPEKYLSNFGSFLCAVSEILKFKVLSHFSIC